MNVTGIFETIYPAWGLDRSLRSIISITDGETDRHSGWSRITSLENLEKLGTIHYLKCSFPRDKLIPLSVFISCHKSKKKKKIKSAIKHE